MVLRRYTGVRPGDGTPDAAPGKVIERALSRHSKPGLALSVVEAYCCSSARADACLATANVQQGHRLGSTTELIPPTVSGSVAKPPQTNRQAERGATR